MYAEFPFRIGDVLVGKYRLDRVIGSGGMGVVFAANHLELQRRVAIKLLRADQSDHEGSVARIMQEARAVARLNGPNVAKVLDVGRLESGLPYLVMELLEGRNLHDLIQEQGPLSNVLAADYVLQACEAVAEAHRVGVVHRDLKPANLFLTRDPYGEPVIKVLDFGISKILEPIDPHDARLTDSQCMIGSPVYMSPEQMHSARDVDHRCDIWGLGTILFEMLSGRPVWEGQTFSDLCAQVMRDPCPRLSELRSEVPVELASIVERCLRKDPLARYQQVSDLAMALANFASDRGRDAARRVLLMAGQASASAQSVTCSSQRLLSHADPLSTAIALPATALTRFTRRARARIVPVLVLSGLLLFGWRALRSERDRAESEHPELSARIAASPAHSTGLEPTTSDSRPSLPSSLEDAAAPVTTAQTSSAARRPAGQPSKRLANSRVSSGLNTAHGSTAEPSLVPSVDPMSIRKVVPVPPMDPMSIRK